MGVGLDVGKDKLHEEVQGLHHRFAFVFVFEHLAHILSRQVSVQLDDVFEDDGEDSVCRVESPPIKVSFMF